MPISAGPTTTPHRITKTNLVRLSKARNVKNALFDDDERSRALQEAGKLLGFNLRLECYEQTTTRIEDWAQSLEFLLSERSIFKDYEDIVAMSRVAESFGSGVHSDDSAVLYRNCTPGS
jgi:hypothetical protein